MMGLFPKTFCSFLLLKTESCWKHKKYLGNLFKLELQLQPVIKKKKTDYTYRLQGKTFQISSQAYFELILPVGTRMAVFAH